LIHFYKRFFQKKNNKTNTMSENFVS